MHFERKVESELQTLRTSNLGSNLILAGAEELVVDVVNLRQTGTGKANEDVALLTAIGRGFQANTEGSAEIFKC